MTGWRTAVLGDLVADGQAEIRTGPFGTELRASDYTTNGVPVLNVRNLGYGGVRLAILERVDDVVQKRLSGHLLTEGDIVFGRKGAVDRHVLVRSQQSGWMQGSDCIRLRLSPNAPVSPEFLSKALLTPSHRNWMESQCSHGATMASLNQEILSRISVAIPSSNAQRAIVAALSAFDDLIEINERRIELLEDLARSLYREWFLRFRFPEHASTKLLDLESAMGPIPEGWEVFPLKDLARIVMGQSPESRHFNEDGIGIPFHQGVSTYGHLLPEHRTFSTVGSRMAERWDVLCSVRAPVGRLNLADQALIVGRGLAAIRRLDGYVALLLEQLRIALGAEDSLGGGTIFKAINKHELAGLMVLEPSARCRDQFERVARPILEQRVALTYANRTLARTRDLLLPRLVTGRLDISDIDLGDLLPEAAAA